MEIEYIRKGQNNEFSEQELKHIKRYNLTKGITNYLYDTYDGEGFLIATNGKGVWFKFECGHCSCYGPLEQGLSGKFTKEEIYKIIDNVDCYLHTTEKDKESFKKFIINNN